MFNRLIRYIRKYGFIHTCTTVAIYSFNFLNNKKNDFLSKFSVEFLIHKRRIRLSKSLSRQMNNTVGYGPFSGLILTDYIWNRVNVGNRLLGLYEKEVLQSLYKVPASHKTLVDMGAADGYFAIGCLIANMFNKVYCFESSPDAQKKLFDNASLNHVQDRIEIFGLATKKFPFELQGKGVDISKCVVLCDIEGGEFEVFDENTLKALKGAVIIIEIHDWHKNGIGGYSRLRERVGKYFNITTLTTGSRDLSPFTEVAKLSDNDRWLLCSEGRNYLTTWLRLDPKSY